MSDDDGSVQEPLAQSGRKTSEFLLTSAGMFLSALIGLLAAFNVLVFTPEQKLAVYKFVAIAWIALPIAYTWARTHLKANAMAPVPMPKSVVNVDASTYTKQEQEK